MLVRFFPEEKNMEKTVNMPPETTAEIHSEFPNALPAKAKSCRVGRCLLALLVVFVVLLTGINVWEMATYFQGKNSVSSLRNMVNARVKAHKKQMTNYARKWTTEERMWAVKEINDSEHSLRRYVDSFKSNTNNEIRKLKLQDGKTGGRIEPNLNTTVQMIKKDVHSLISVVGSLIQNLTRLDNSSDSKMHRLRSALKDAKDDLIDVEHELTRLNVSLRAEFERTGDSLVAYIENLRKNVTVLSHFSTSRINQLWLELNQTNEDILKILEAMSQQNETFHSKVRYTSDALYVEVKSVEKKLAGLRNSSSTKLHRLRSDLNNTQGNLQMAHNDISRLNRSLGTALKEIANSLRSSKNVKEKMTELKNDFESNKKDAAAENKAINEKISKAKVEFREANGKSQEGISGLKKKLDSLETKILSQGKKIKEQSDTIQQLKNEASGLPHISFVTILSVIALLSFFM